MRENDIGPYDPADLTLLTRAFYRNNKRSCVG